MQSVPADSHDRPRRVLRPANYVAGTPGYGFYEGELPSGQTYAVIDLQGRIFMASLEDPFRVADSLLQKIQGESDPGGFSCGSHFREGCAWLVP